MRTRIVYCIAVFLVFGMPLPARAQLQPGDVIIIGVHSDGADRFAWVPLVALPPGQELFFTDAGWNAAQRMFQRRVNAAADSAATAPSGGAIKYTTPAAGLAAGTVVEVRIDGRTAGEPGDYVLTVTGADALDFSAANDRDIVGDQGVSLSTTGDQLIVFTGSPANPAFIFGVNTGADRWVLGSTTAQHSSDVPDGLVDGATAVAIGAGPDAGDEVDNGRYIGPASGTRETILAAAAASNNWETSDVDIPDITHGVAAFDVSVGASGPALAFTPPELAFGDVTLGGFRDEVVTLRNTGGTPLDVTGISFADGHAGFSATSAPAGPVAPGSDSTVTVRFAPAQAGAALDTLILSHNAPGSPVRVPLSGMGVTPSATTVTVALDTVFVAPGDTARVAIRLINDTARQVGGLQFRVGLNGVLHAAFDSLTAAPEDAGFTVRTVLAGAGDSLSVVVFTTSGATLGPGTHLLGRLRFIAHDGAANLGAESVVRMVGGASLLVSDDRGEAIGSTGEDGAIQIGVRGDVTKDGAIDIRDVVVLVRAIVTPDVPAEGSVGRRIDDLNRDGAVNVADVIAQVNTILGLPFNAAPRRLAGPPALVSLDEAVTLPDGRTALPVRVDARRPVAGAEAVFTFDPTALQVGAPRLTGDTSGLALDSRVAKGTLRVVAYSLTAERGLADGGGSMLLIPVAAIEEGAALTLSGALIVNRRAQTTPVRFGATIRTVSTRTAAPSAFALTGNAPNPFNPNTTIAYEVPQQAHIMLAVYNILGQEVIRLVDAVQRPGRYAVVWHGTNAQGTGVASGIYLYRLTSSTGFSRTKRMTLLK